MPRGKKTGLAPSDGGDPAPTTKSTRGPRTNVGFSLEAERIRMIAAMTGADEKTVKARLEKALRTVAVDHVTYELDQERKQAKLEEVRAAEAALAAKRDEVKQLYPELEEQPAS